MNQTIEGTIDSVSAIDSSKEIIHPELKKRVEDLSKSRVFKDFPDIPMEESCFLLYSWISEEESIHFLSDSTIRLSYNSCSDGTPQYYRGVLQVDGYNIAIFDPFNFIDNYCNTDSLQQIPFESFKCYPTEVLLIDIFYIQNGELKRRYPLVRD